MSEGVPSPDPGLRARRDLAWLMRVLPPSAVPTAGKLGFGYGLVTGSPKLMLAAGLVDEPLPLGSGQEARDRRERGAIAFAQHLGLDDRGSGRLHRVRDHDRRAGVVLGRSLRQRVLQPLRRPLVTEHRGDGALGVAAADRRGQLAGISSGRWLDPLGRPGVEAAGPLHEPGGVEQAAQHLRRRPAGSRRATRVAGPAGRTNRRGARGRAARPGPARPPARCASVSPCTRVVVLTTFSDDEKVLDSVKPVPPATC